MKPLQEQRRWSFETDFEANKEYFTPTNALIFWNELVSENGNSEFQTAEFPGIVNLQRTGRNTIQPSFR